MTHEQLIHFHFSKTAAKTSRNTEENLTRNSRQHNCMYRQKRKKKISRTRVSACHLNISFHACMPAAPHTHTHLHTHRARSAAKHYVQKTQAHMGRSMLEHTHVQESLELELSDIYRSVREGKKKKKRVRWGRYVMTSVALTN